jgi:hypothetical protein
MSVSFEWLLGTVTLIVGTLLGVIWKTLTNDLEKHKSDDHARHTTMWGHIEELRRAVTEIKEMRGSYTAELENIKSQIAAIPKYEKLCEMLRESEVRIENRIATLLSVIKK